MKKLLYYILIISVMLTMLIVPSSVKAGEKELKILSPGNTCTTELEKIVVSCENAYKIIYELDGEVIGETDGECELALTDGILAPGNHVLRVTALFADGTGAREELSFNAEKYVKKMSFYQDFNSMTAESKPLQDLGLSVNTNNSKWGTTIIKYFPEQGYNPEDEKDKSFCLEFQVDNEIASNYPNFYVYTGFTDYDKNGVLVSEFDVKSKTPDLSDISVSGIPRLTDISAKVIGGGKIAGTDVTASDEWYRFKITHDSSKSTTKLEVNGETLYDGTMAGSWSNMIQFSFKQNGTRTPETREKIWFDNFNFNNYLVWGLQSVSYDTGDGNWQVYSDGQLPSDTSKIKLGVVNELIGESVTNDTVKLYENGIEIVDKSVSYAGKEVVISLYEPLSKSSDIKIELGSDIKFSKGESVEEPLIARMKTESAPLSPKSIVFKKDSNILYTSGQLSSGDSVSVEAELNNDTSETQTMTVVLYVIQNKKSRGISAQEFTLEPGQELPVTITIPSLANLDAMGDVSVRMSLCGDISSPVPFMDYAEVK